MMTMRRGDRNNKRFPHREVGFFSAAISLSYYDTVPDAR